MKAQFPISQWQLDSVEFVGCFFFKFGLDGCVRRHDSLHIPHLELTGKKRDIYVKMIFEQKKKRNQQIQSQRFISHKPSCATTNNFKLI